MKIPCWRAFFFFACAATATFGQLKGGSSTDIDNYCAEFTQAIVNNLRTIHTGWSGNTYRVATFGNSLTYTAQHWEPLNSPVSGISTATAINAFKDTTFNRNGWLLFANSKGPAHGNESGRTIAWVAQQVPTVLAGDQPMAAEIMIGTNNVRNGWGGASCTTSLDCWPDTIEYAQIISQLIAAHVIPIITTFPPINNAADLGWEPRTHDPDTYLIPYNNKLRAFAAHHNLPLIDMHQWCLDHGGAETLLADWAHPKTCAGGDFANDCLDGGASGGAYEVRNYLLTMAIYDIVKYVIEGQNPPADVTAPAAITDLAASTGSFPGSVNLSWSATGDDNTTGTASSYDIRYSTETINEGNFSAATAVSNPPNPQSPSSNETMVVSGLSAGQTYFFAIKAWDGSNTSAISNIVSAAAASTVTRDDSVRLDVVADTYLECNDPAPKGSAIYLKLKSGNQGVILLKFDMSGLAFTPDSAIIFMRPSLYADTFYYYAYARTIAADWDETTKGWTGSVCGISLDSALGALAYQVKATGLVRGAPVQSQEYAFGIGRDIIRSYAAGTSYGIALIDLSGSARNNVFASREGEPAKAAYMMAYIKGPVAAEKNAMATAHAVLKISPNPCNPTATIQLWDRFSNEPAKASGYSLKIFGTNGKMVADLSGKTNTGGAVIWDARGISSGVYVVRAQVNGKTLVKNVTLLK